MAWSEKRANERVEANDFSKEEITISDLCKEMDFENLGPKDVRRGQGIHLYVDIANFDNVVTSAKSDKQKLKKVIRGASVLRKIESELLELEEVSRIQLQGVRLHAFNYKPYDEQSRRVEKAIIVAITLNTYLLEVFNPLFPELADLTCAVGMAAGETLIANIGAHGERELISIGTPANLAAKILSEGNSLRITESMFCELNSVLVTHFKEVDADYAERIFEARDLNWLTHTELATSLGVSFNKDKWTRKTEEYRDAMPLSEIEISDADVKIDIDQLTEHNSKLVDSVVLFVDLDGFTNYVQAAERDEDRVDLVRKLHMMRAEFHAVVINDFDGLVIDHRGDCMVCIVHLPPGENEGNERAEEGVDIALGLQSSMEHVLQKYLGDREGIHVAIGVDIGLCIVSRLGKKGDRQVVCLGIPVVEAERLQRQACGEDIRVTGSLYRELPEGAGKENFKKQDDGTFLMEKMTFPRLREIEAVGAVVAGKVKMSSILGGVIVGKANEGEAIPNHLQQTRPWLSK